MRSLFLKLDTLMYLSSCSVVHRASHSTFYSVRASLRCSVKGVVHSVVRDLQFLGNFSNGIAFISQNKYRLKSFRRKVFVSGLFEPAIDRTNAEAPDSLVV